MGIAILSAGFVVVTTILGIIRQFSPVPFWDGLGVLPFYSRFSHGADSRWTLLWQNENEHRFVLSKLLNLVDVSHFGGVGSFLLFMNVVFLTCVLVLLLRPVWRGYARSHETATRITVAATVFALGFSWLQQEAIAWGYNIHFYLTYLLPFFASTIYEKDTILRFLLAAALGVSSVGTLAVGLAALPLLALQATVLHRNLYQAAGFAVLGALAVIAFFTDYHPPDHTASGLTLGAALGRGVAFVAMGLGVPVMRLTGSDLLGQLTGAGLLLGCLLALLYYGRLLKTFPQRAALVTPIILLIGLCLLSWVATAHARSGFGVSYAANSRYTVPTLLIWSALLVLVADFATRYRGRVVRPMLVALSIAVIAVVLPSQDGALRWDHEQAHRRLLAALAFELGVQDPETTAKIVWNHGAGAEMTRPAIEQNLSVFGQLPLVDLRALLGKTMPQDADDPRQQVTVSCHGSLQGSEVVPSDSSFLRIHGFFTDPRGPIGRGGERAVLVLDQQKKVIGAAITGRPHGDGQRAAFDGYLRASDAGDVAFLAARGSDCLVPVAEQLP